MGELKIWGRDIEENTIRQAEKATRLPIVYGHVALMPDAHVGMGSTIGSVIPTEGAIIPAAVGVDVGCFTGDTQIMLVSTKIYSIKELADGHEFIVFSCTPDGHIKAASATAKLTRRNAPLVKVTFDNGKTIKCTPDHKFMLRDGSYKQICDIPIGTPLMNFSPPLSDEYVGVFQSMEVLPYTEDVYCLSVPQYNNFALEAGVFVHNCGMGAVETDLTANDLPDNLQPLVLQFERSIPSGVGRGRNLESKGQTDQLITKRAQTWMLTHPHNLDGRLPKTAISQLGTLGSGNHFLEVCLDENNHVWIMLHSGSRGVGNQLADKHIKLAKTQQQALEDPDLAYFLEGTDEFKNYISDMLWGQSYALENREIMLTVALMDLFRLIGKGKEVNRVLCHHNYANLEFHFGKWLWITRKGAIQALRGSLAVIPGSMGTQSYIVEGLSNPDSYNSSSHGAGRRMSRGQARRELTPESLTEVMKDKAWNKDAKHLVDEHPLAYKDIDRIIEDSKDLVKVVHKLHQVVNYKGL